MGNWVRGKLTFTGSARAHVSGAATRSLISPARPSLPPTPPATHPPPLALSPEVEAICIFVNLPLSKLPGGFNFLFLAALDASRRARSSLSDPVAPPTSVSVQKRFFVLFFNVPPALEALANFQVQNNIFLDEHQLFGSKKLSTVFASPCQGASAELLQKPPKSTEDCVSISNFLSEKKKILQLYSKYQSQCHTVDSVLCRSLVQKNIDMVDMFYGVNSVS